MAEEVKRGVEMVSDSVRYVHPPNVATRVHRRGVASYL